jgi:hypothetical protein
MFTVAERLLEPPPAEPLGVMIKGGFLRRVASRRAVNPAESALAKKAQRGLKMRPLRISRSEGSQCAYISDVARSAGASEI